MKERIIHQTHRVVIAAAGGTIILLGIIMVPYPGPGWLVVFAGLAILATEFEFAQNILDKLHAKYDKWQEWVRHQNLAIQIIVWLFTALMVFVTVWLVNGFGIINHLFRLNVDWLISPIFA